MWKRTKRQVAGKSSTVRWLAYHIPSLSVPVNYFPRTRPTRPILSHPRLLPTIKSMPEEWIQTLSKMEVRPGSILQPIDCHVRQIFISQPWLP